MNPVEGPGFPTLRSIIGVLTPPLPPFPEKVEVRFEFAIGPFWIFLFSSLFFFFLFFFCPGISSFAGSDLA